MPIYRPRMAVRMLVPLDFGVANENRVVLEPRLQSASLTLNDFQHADELEFTCEWSALGIDPRMARAAAVEFYIGDLTSSTNELEKARRHFRFAGLVDTVERSAGDGGHFAKVKCRDYTAPFLAMKPCPREGVPLVTDTLLDAWQRICDHVGYRDPATKEIRSSVALLRNRIEFLGGLDPGLVIADAMAPRFRAVGGRVHVEPNADAWAVFQQCVGSLGAIAYIDRDACVVTTSVDAYADDGEEAPALIYGRNILEMTETADSTWDGKGVWLTSFDPMTGKTIEAHYPEPSALPPRGAKATGSDGTTGGNHRRRAKAGGATVDAKDYWHQEYHAVSDPDLLQKIAQRTWEARARQEMRGQLKTAEMRVPVDARVASGAAVLGASSSVTRGEVDLLALRCGDSIRVEIDHVDREIFSRLPTEVDRANYLIDLGYQPTAAWILARNSRKAAFGRTFKVSDVRIHLSADGDSGEFRIEIGYLNKIAIGGPDVDARLIRGQSLAEAL